MTGGEGPLSARADESVTQPDNTHTHCAPYPTSVSNTTATTSGLSLSAQAALFNEQKEKATMNQLSFIDIKPMRSEMFKQT